MGTISRDEKDSSGESHRRPRKKRDRKGKKIQRAKISLIGKFLQIESPYSEVTVESFRRLQGVWDRNSRVWKLPYEFKDQAITVLKKQGMDVDIDVPANLDQNELAVREAAANKIRSALSKDPRHGKIDSKMMRKLTELGIGDAEQELKEKERLEKYGIDKTEWRIKNINTPYWQKQKNKRVS